MTAQAIDFHGLPAVRWSARDGATAVATLQGAHLVSWVPAGGDERLYVSERSPFAPGRPIRGGIPVVFPQFADRGPLQQHGFARNVAWRFAGTEEGDAGTTARFTLDASDATRAHWPHAFRLELRATIGGPSLRIALQVSNVGEAPFAFTAALHTYLRVEDAAQARLHGLQGIGFLTRGAPAREVEDRAIVTAAEPIDRIYFAAPAALRLETPARTLAIAQAGFSDTVVWNPGSERCAQMADMPPDGHRAMLCVEAAAVEPAVQLPPGAHWQGTQELAVR